MNSSQTKTFYRNDAGLSESNNELVDNAHTIIPVETHPHYHSKQQQSDDFYLSIGQSEEIISNEVGVKMSSLPPITATRQQVTSNTSNNVTL